MHHWMSKPDWLDELNEDLAKRNVRIKLDFDDFVLVENDWVLGREPEDVADTIANGEHSNVHLSAADIEKTVING